jgi:GTPase SAR1 family protein
MGGWLSSWWGGGDWAEQAARERKIVMVGLDNAGKTTILYKLVERDTRRRHDTQQHEQHQASLLSRFFIDYGSADASSSPSPEPQAIVSLAPTIGFQVEAVRCGDGGPVLAVWDVGGQTRLRQLWPICYGGAEAAVFVVDAADLDPRHDRLGDARAALVSLLSAPELRGAPLLLLANKSDDARALAPRQVLEALGLLNTSSSSSSSSKEPEPTSYAASLAGYSTIPTGQGSSSASSSAFSPLLKGRRCVTRASCNACLLLMVVRMCVAMRFQVVGSSNVRAHWRGARRGIQVAL